MDEFFIYLRLGFDHITGPRGLDHILFVIALCAIYTGRQWQRVLILVTAFTLGHTITLALATLNIIQYSTALVELLIPITILLTAITNFFHVAPITERQRRETKNAPLRYGLALGFGLIHGLGFSNYLRSLLGQESSIITPLVSFNIGLELGQLLIISAVLLLSYVAIDVLNAKRHNWNLIVSGMVAGMAISLILARLTA